MQYTGICLKKSQNLCICHTQRRSQITIFTKNTETSLLASKKKRKTMYYQTLLGNCGNISVTWKTIKNMLNKNASKDNSQPNQLNINKHLISNASSICNEFNRHFCNIGKMAKKAPALTSDISNSFCSKPV